MNRRDKNVNTGGQPKVSAGLQRATNNGEIVNKKSVRKNQKPGDIHTCTHTCKQAGPTPASSGCRVGLPEVEPVQYKFAICNINLD